MLKYSFLDCLIDENTGSSFDQHETVPEFLLTMGINIGRDLEALLSTPRYRGKWSPQLKELVPSILDYGIPDYLNNFFDDGDEFLTVFLKEIEIILNRYETRLQQIIVVRQKEEEINNYILKFSIHSVFNMPLEGYPFIFDITINLQDLNMVLKGN